VSHDTPPRNLTALNQRMRNLEGDEILAFRRRTTMALVVVGQMLPEGAVKGGSAMALRYGSNTRFTWRHSAPTSKSAFEKDGVGSLDVWSSSHPRNPREFPPRT
jgi:hypothetical protein